MRNFDWEDFRHFTALARTLNLGAAAARLRTSQVTVMRRVKALERSLGTTLFVRRRDGHRLSPAGTRLFALAQDAEQVLGDVGRAVGDDDASPLGHVRIATTEVGANWILLPRLAQFRAQHPDIRLEIDASPQALDLLQDTETIALRFRRPEAGSYVVKRVGSLPHALYATKHLLKASAKSPASNVLQDLPYIGWAGPFAEIGLARWLRKICDGRLPIVALTTMQGHVDLGRAGVGVVCLPDFIAQQFHELVRLDGAGEYVLEAWLVVPAQIRQVARIKAAAGFVGSAAKAVVQR